MENPQFTHLLETLFSTSNSVDLVLLLPFLIGMSAMVGVQIESTFMGEIDEILSSNLLLQEKLLLLSTFTLSLIVTIISVVIIAERMPLPINPTIMEVAAGTGFLLSRRNRRSRSAASTYTDLH